MVQKCEALRTLDNVETTQKLAEKCGVGGVTVGDWNRVKLTKLKNGIYGAVQWSPQRCSSVHRSGSDRGTRGPTELPTDDSGFVEKDPSFQITTALPTFDPD
jgi:hypothetical protein